VGIEKFREEVKNNSVSAGGFAYNPLKKDEFLWNKKDHIGVYRQKQPGLNFAALHIPIGRLYAQDMFDLAWQKCTALEIPLALSKPDYSQS